MRVSIASPLMQIRAFGRTPICDMKGALIPGPSLRPIALGSLKAGALTKAVENALSQRCVVTIEMMAAGGANDLRLSLKGLTSSVILVSAVEALNHARVDRCERRFGRQSLLTGAGANQSGDTDLEIGCSSKAEERQLNDVRFRFGRQAIISKAHLMHADA